MFQIQLIKKSKKKLLGGDLLINLDSIIFSKYLIINAMMTYKRYLVTWASSK